jgi:energy-coupling factor transporter ATP-binding protein EcfA2
MTLLQSRKIEEDDPVRDPVIEAEKLSKTYPMGSMVVYALRDASFRVRAGEFVALMGASGSGKSTLLTLLGCLDRPTSGRYALEGQDAGEDGPGEDPRGAGDHEEDAGVDEFPNQRAADRPHPQPAPFGCDLQLGEGKRVGELPCPIRQQAGDDDEGQRGQQLGARIEPVDQAGALAVLVGEVDVHAASL